MKISSILALVAVTGTLAPAALAQITFSGSYAQNFDSMGTGAAAPAGWSELSLSGSHDDFRFAGSTAAITTTVLPSDGPAYIRSGPAGTSTLTTNATLTVATGPTTQKGTGGYNLALAASSTDRALGTSPSGNAESQLQLSLTNATSDVITGFTVSYDIRRFTTTTVNNSGYQGANVGLEELPGYWLFYSLDGGQNWTNVSALNPTKTGPDGVIVPNTVGVTNVPATSFTLASPVAAGSGVLLRWVDDNAQSPSPDQIIGLDNVTITSVPTPGSLALLTLGALGVARRNRR
jgi:hypothetical protein